MPADALAERWPCCDGRHGVLAEQQWSSSAIAPRDTCSCPGRVSLGQWDFTPLLLAHSFVVSSLAVLPLLAVLLALSAAFRQARSLQPVYARRSERASETTLRKSHQQRRQASNYSTRQLLPSFDERPLEPLPPISTMLPDGQMAKWQAVLCTPPRHAHTQ